MLGAGDSAKIDPSIKACSAMDFPDIQVTRISRLGPFLWQHDMVGPLWRQSRGCSMVFLASPYFISTWVAATLLRLKGQQVLFWGHLRMPASDGFVRRYVTKFFYSLANTLLPYGHTAKGELVRAGFDRAQIHVIYNSLDHVANTALRGAAERADRKAILGRFFSDWQRPTLICVSRILKKRRLDLALDALRILKARQMPVNLLLVGEGDEAAFLQARAQSEGLAVGFFGACYDESEIAQLYGACDITIAPGEVGLTAIQSLEFGVPVVTHGDHDHQMPESESVIEGVTGRLFKRNDAADLARVIYEMVAAGFDKCKWRRACYLVVDRFFTPQAQVNVIVRATAGLCADDGDWNAVMNKLSGSEC